MAYSMAAASVRESEIESIRQDPNLILHPTMLVRLSHVIGWWIQIRPLASLLRVAVDGGEVLNLEPPHPLRPTRFHRPAEVLTLASQLQAAYASTVMDYAPAESDWLAAQVESLIGLYRDAASRIECVVTALDPPGGVASNEGVRLPWAAEVHFRH